MASNGGILPRGLRGVASLFSITAATLMITARQRTTRTTYMDSHVYFGDLAAYWYFVFANFTIAGYSALLICLPSKSQLWRFAVALDLILTVIIFSSCSAALAVGSMEGKGNSHAGWLPICHTFPIYCLRVFLAIGIGFFGSLMYVMVQLLCIQEAFNSILLD